MHENWDNLQPQVSQQLKTKLLPEENRWDVPSPCPTDFHPCFDRGFTWSSDAPWHVSWMKPLTSIWVPYVVFFGRPMGVLMSGTGPVKVVKTYSRWVRQIWMNKYNTETWGQFPFFKSSHMNKKKSGKYDIFTKEFLPTHKAHRDETWNASGVWDKRYHTYHTCCVYSNHVSRYGLHKCFWIL